MQPFRGLLLGVCNDGPTWTGTCIYSLVPRPKKERESSLSSHGPTNEAIGLALLLATFSSKLCCREQQNVQ